MHRGTCFPAPVSEKNVLNESSSDAPIEVSARHLATGDRARKRRTQSQSRVARPGQRKRRYFPAVDKCLQRLAIPWTTRPHPFERSRARGARQPARSIASRRAASRAHALRLDPVFEAVQLPARVPGLHAGLTDVNGDHLAHVARASLVRALRAVPRAVSSSVVVGERFEVAAATTRVEKCVASARPGRLSP